MGQIKAPIAGNSKAIDKIGNAELAHFNKQMLIHELIRGSLNSNSLSIAAFKPCGESQQRLIVRAHRMHLPGFMNY
jgi:hypothetical protein